MSNHAEKKAARAYAVEHGINYQKALTALRDQAAAEEIHPASGGGRMRPGQDSLRVEVGVCERQADGSLFYGEYVREHWLARPGGGFRSWSITLPLIDAIPGLAEAITARLRDEVPQVYAAALATYGEDLTGIGSPPHPDELTDRELIERWHKGGDPWDEVYSDGDLVASLGHPDSYPTMPPEHVNPFQACVVQKFPGLSDDGCDRPVAARAYLPGDTPLDEAALHSRLMEQVPDWGSFLDLIGPWHLPTSFEVLTARR